MRLWQELIGILFPIFCVECGAKGALICDKCWLQVVFVYEQGCPVCYEASVGGLTHPKCKTAWGLDGLWCVAYYRGPVRRLVRQLKYHQAAVVVRAVGQLVAGYLEQERIYVQPGVLLPVPLHESAKRRRSFNQAELIAEQLALCLGLPMVGGVVKRIKQVPSQTRLGRQERRQNVQGIFAIDLQKWQREQVIKDKTFVLVDDVFTSGATMSEMAKVLKRAGAAKVFGLALARD